MLRRLAWTAAEKLGLQSTFKTECTAFTRLHQMPLLTMDEELSRTARGRWYRVDRAEHWRVSSARGTNLLHPRCKGPSLPFELQVPLLECIRIETDRLCD